MKHWKTTATGILTILAALATAALSYLKSGTVDAGATFIAITAGIGLIKASDAPISTPAA